MKRQSGFTLLELLVVVGLIATTSFLLLSGLAGGGKRAPLHSGQTTLANLVVAARIRASATGRKTRLLVNAEPAAPARYLRLVVLQVAEQAGGSPTEWTTLQTVSVPAGIYIVPGSLAGLVSDTTHWRRVSDPADELSSDLFVNQGVSYLLPGDGAAQRWTGVAFTPNGTLAALASGPPPKGSIVLAAGRLRTPDGFAPGQPPVELEDPAVVCGLFLSAYGIPALLTDRDAF